MSLVFEYDPGKAARNVAKHGVSFAEAATVFVDPLALETPDLAHSSRERRLLLVGRSYRQRLLVVVFTQRFHSIRIFSAREATRHEGRDYEEGS